MESGNLSGHDGEVLDSGVVGEPEGVPDDNVVVDDVIPILDPGLDALSTDGLVGVVTSREQLTVLVLGDPDGGLAELGSSPVPGARLSEEHLRADWHELVASGGQGDPVLHVGVDNLEDTAVGKAVLNSTSSVDSGLLADVACTQRVQLLVPRHLNRVRVDERVLVAIDSRVDTDVEQVLMVRSHDTIGNASSPRNLGLLVNGLSGEDTSSSGLEGDLSVLVKDPGKDVLVVGNSDDLLKNKLSLADDDRLTGSVVGVLPLDALVDLVDADGVGTRSRGSVSSDNAAVDVLNDTKAVAPNCRNVSR